jgi:hypothetical protein
MSDIPRRDNITEWMRGLKRKTASRRYLGRDQATAPCVAPVKAESPAVCCRPRLSKVHLAIRWQTRPEQYPLVFVIRGKSEMIQIADKELYKYHV